MTEKELHAYASTYQLLVTEMLHARYSNKQLRHEWSRDFERLLLMEWGETPGTPVETQKLQNRVIKQLGRALIRLSELPAYQSAKQSLYELGKSVLGASSWAELIPLMDQASQILFADQAGGDQ